MLKKLCDLCFLRASVVMKTTSMIRTPNFGWNPKTGIEPHAGFANHGGTEGTENTEDPCVAPHVFNLDTEMRTTEYSDHTESKRVGGLVAYTRNMSPTDFLSVLFSVYSVYSVVRHLPF